MACRPVTLWPSYGADERRRHLGAPYIVNYGIVTAGSTHRDCPAAAWLDAAGESRDKARHVGQYQAPRLAMGSDPSPPTCGQRLDICARGLPPSATVVPWAG